MQDNGNSNSKILLGSFVLESTDLILDAYKTIHGEEGSNYVRNTLHDCTGFYLPSSIDGVVIDGKMEDGQYLVDVYRKDGGGDNAQRICEFLKNKVTESNVFYQ